MWKKDAIAEFIIKSIQTKLCCIDTKTENGKEMDTDKDHNTGEEDNEAEDDDDEENNTDKDGRDWWISKYLQKWYRVFDFFFLHS